MYPSICYLHICISAYHVHHHHRVCRPDTYPRTYYIYNTVRTVSLLARWHARIYSPHTAGPASSRVRLQDHLIIITSVVQSAQAQATEFSDATLLYTQRLGVHLVTVPHLQCCALHA